MGLKQDAEIAIIAFSFATDYIRLGADQFMKAYRKEFLIQQGCRPSISLQRKIRNNYVEGWISGLESQYSEQVSKEGWGLVLMKDALVTRTYKEMDLKRGKSSQYARGESQVGRLAYAKGYSDGKGFSAAQGRLRA